MRRVGVVVEGPTDLVFWNRVLGRAFSSRGYWFDVRSLNGINRVIQEAPALADDFRKAGYHSAIFILDADKEPCPSAVLARFNGEFMREARSEPASARFVHILIAFRELESWVLADETCVRALLEFSIYEALPDATQPAGKAKLLRLCRAHGASPSGMEDREFARQAAGHFDPVRTSERSSSFAHCWQRLTARLETAPA